MRRRFDRCGDAGKTIFVDRMIEVDAPFSPFHLHEGNDRAALGDQIDLSDGRFAPLVEDLPSFRPEPEGCSGFTVTAILLRRLALHAERSSIARAYNVLRSIPVALAT